MTQRRWLAFCNPPLRDLITKQLGSDNWILHLDELAKLRKWVAHGVWGQGGGQGRGGLP